MMPSSPSAFDALNLDGGSTGANGSTGLPDDVLLCMAMLEQDFLAQMQSSAQGSPTSQDDPSQTGSSGGVQSGGDDATDASTRDAQILAMLMQDLLQSVQTDDDDPAAASGGQSGSSPDLAAGPQNVQDSTDTSTPPPGSSSPSASAGTGSSASSGTTPGTGSSASSGTTPGTSSDTESSTSSGAEPSTSSATGPTASSSTSDASSGGVQFSGQWNTIPFQNKTDEPLTVQLTMGAGQSLPSGVGSNGQFTIPPGGTVNLTFAENGPGFNFKTTTGDGSAWNQGEVTFSSNGSSHSTAFDMSYIYGANSNMNIYSSDGQSSGYQGNLFANVPADAKAGNWGIAAPLSATSADASGPDAPTNAPATFLYGTIPEGKGYVGVGKPAESSSYDDASSLMTNGNIAVVFS